ncbi:MAG: hypothetical protein R2825_10695 [Saprospiraceae bacterium]
MDKHGRHAGDLQATFSTRLFFRYGIYRYLAQLNFGNNQPESSTTVISTTDYYRVDLAGTTRNNELAQKARGKT